MTDTVRIVIAELTRAALALVVVAGGGVMIFLSWSADSTRDPGVIISGAFATIGGVLAWYFGTRGLDKAQEAAADANERRMEAKASGDQILAEARELGGLVETLADQVEGLQPSAARLEKILQAARKDPALAEKLKKLERE